MRLLDSRRLTGASLYLPAAGAVMDISVADGDRELLIAAWRRQVTRLIEDLGWPVQLNVRAFDGGVSLAMAAPEDGLYTATDVNETAWDAARDWVQGSCHHLLLRAARQLRSDYRDEERPRLQRLLAAAREHNTQVILDDDTVTLGTGRFAESFDLFEVPHPDDVDWPRRRSVPTALVTGTNGKTTTVRLLAGILKAAGKVAGVSSTDWLAMGDELLSRDDYAGPAGARGVLRDTRCQVAVLETARGGLMRRGLAVSHADVALITNIAADHLGDYGIHTVDDLADVKWSVTRALGGTGRLVLNAEDPLLMARAATSTAALVLFALNAKKSAAFKGHVAAGGVGFTVQRGAVVKCRGKRVDRIIPLAKIPITFNGIAQHNVANALAAAAVADGLKVPIAAIASGLAAFTHEDNPGRGNIYRIAGVTVFVDFAHNPAGLNALMPVVNGLESQRRLLVTGQAGDRSDQDIRDFADAAGSARFDRVIIKRMDGHSRGREIGEAAKIMREAFLAQGYSRRSIGMATTEIDATRAALRWAKPGDLVVLLSHEKRDQTRELLHRLAETRGP